MHFSIAWLSADAVRRTVFWLIWIARRWVSAAINSANWVCQNWKRTKRQHWFPIWKIWISFRQLAAATTLCSWPTRVLCTHAVITRAVNAVLATIQPKQYWSRHASIIADRQSLRLDVVASFPSFSISRETCTHSVFLNTVNLVSWSNMLCVVSGQFYYGICTTPTGHNTDGKYFINSNKMSFHFETSPKRIVLYFEKSKDGHVTPIEGVQIVDFSCGNNHTVSGGRNRTWFTRN